MLEYGAKLLNNRHITIETEKKSQKLAQNNLFFA
jgi:hypothetical protein